ncbi:hypothetical protein [Halobacteriaceae bacterium SHR40]|uniref:hypothetical protein n=1 Tax=Halovenus amylolytica TaxID=2500550 RepID=UPI000FE44030
MQDITLKMPKQIVDSLPADSDATKQDMQKAMGGWEQDLNTALNVDDEMVSAIVDIIERFEDRWERYDEYVVELRAWGQSPIYAMAWRDLHAAVLHQIHDHQDLSDRISRERHHRIFDDGIRPGKG